MLMHLQFDGRGPLHAQLTRALKAAMIAGRIGPGTRLPATRLLAQELGLSRNTVLSAYEQLRAEGFIDGRVGSGSYAASPLQAQRTASPPQQTTVARLSRYARRARRFHVHDHYPGRAIPGMRHSFQYGVPLVNPALTTAWARALSHAAQYTPPGYPKTQGLPALREAVCDYLARRRGIDAEPEDVLIVAGTQQALALTARILLDAGDEVAIEEPHYHAIRVVLQTHGARLNAVAVDAQGLRCELLAQTSSRLVCVTPSHQFPTGAVLSLPRRMALLDYAERHDSWIFEDDYDGEFRYDSKPLAALRSLDGNDRVIYVGTFSKALFPSLRMGYLLMPRALRRDFISAKWLEDFGSPSIDQAAAASFIADGGFERHLRRASKTLKERRATLLDGLHACSRGRLQIADSHAGMHLVVWLRDRGSADAEALIAHASARGLGLYPITPYYLDPPDRAGLLMGYAGLSPLQIEEALAVFVECLDAVYPVHAVRSARDDGGDQQRGTEPGEVDRVVRQLRQ